MLCCLQGWVLYCLCPSPLSCSQLYSIPLVVSHARSTPQTQLQIWQPLLISTFKTPYPFSLSSTMSSSTRIQGLSVLLQSPTIISAPTQPQPLRRPPTRPSPSKPLSTPGEEVDGRVKESALHPGAVGVGHRDTPCRAFACQLGTRALQYRQIHSCPQPPKA